jgi:hypothetical protein
MSLVIAADTWVTYVTGPNNDPVYRVKVLHDPGGDHQRLVQCFDPIEKREVTFFRNQLVLR